MLRARNVLTATTLVLLVTASAVFGGLPEYQSAVESNPSLIGYWKFDDASANDSSVIATPHNGTLVGTTAFAAGVNGGQALSLTGAGHVNYDVVPEFAFPTSVGTIEAWVNGAVATPGCVVACRDGGPVRYSMHVENSTYTNVWTSLNWTNTNTASGTFAIGTWHYVAYVFDGTDIAIYIDGRRQVDRGGAFSLGTSLTTPFEIGSSSAAGGERWNGLIDEVAIYSAALTPAQVISHFSKMQDKKLITLDPQLKTFFTPADMGPSNVTIGLVGAVGATGGTPVTVTYTAAVITVAAPDNSVIPSGGTVLIPEGASSVVVKVSPTAPVGAGGTSALTVAGTDLLGVTGGVNVKAPPSSDMLAYQAAIRAEPTLISYYTFDEDTGMIIKDVAHPSDPGAVKHDGKLDAATTDLNLAPTAGTHPGGSALQLDGVGMAVFSPTTDFDFSDGTGTIEMWARTTSSTNTNRAIVANRDYNGVRYSMHANPSTDAFGVWNGANFRTTAAAGGYDPNVWYHFAFAFDGTTIHAYLNGVFAGNINSEPIGGGLNLPFLLGAATTRGNDTAERFIGQIDEVAVYSDVLPASSILDHFLKLQPLINMTPDKRFFVMPSDLAVTNVAIGFSGAVGLTGTGTPITLTYDATVIAVTTAAGVAIPSDGTVTMPPGANSVTIKVSGLGVGATTLVASVTNFLPATGNFAVRAAPESQLLNYQAAVMSEPSLISYYTFDTEPTGAVDRAPVSPTPAHDGTFMGGGSFSPRTAVGGGALELTGLGQLNFGPVSDFTFPDGNGTVEAWVRPAWTVNTGDLVFAASRDADVRYSIHVGGGRRYINSFTGDSWGWAVPQPMTEDRWYHVAFVYDNPQVFRCYVDGVLYPSQCNTGYTIGAGGHHSLGAALDQTFQIGSSSSAGRERFIGGIDEVAIYEDALTDAQVQAHYSTMAVGVSPKRHEFLLPSDPGPATVTLTKPAGYTGNVPVTLTFDPAIVSIDAGSGPLASGSTVVLSGSTMNLTVTALSPGATTLVVSAPGFAGGSVVLPVRQFVNNEIIIVNDNFDDNPADDAALGLTSLGMNLLGPGEGWFYTTGKAHKEAGTEWQVLATAGDYVRSQISARQVDDFAVMTPQGAGIEWKITGVTITADSTTAHNQMVGGELSDIYHQLGIVSANRVNNGDNELYTVDTAGDLAVSLFYESTDGGQPGDITVTGNVRAVNKTKVDNGDVEATVGLETLATFALTNVTSITPENPLYVTMKVKQSGWDIGFPASAGVVWTPVAALTGVHIGAGNRLAGGWDVNSLNDAAITDEFNNGAFAVAQVQNLPGGNGTAAIDSVKICVGCQLVGDCPNPFSDADADGDTDQMDFALMQLCFTGDSGAITEGCSCFDQNGNGHVDTQDMASFVNCALLSGPNIPSNKACDD